MGRGVGIEAWLQAVGQEGKSQGLPAELPLPPEQELQCQMEESASALCSNTTSGWT